MTIKKNFVQQLPAYFQTETNKKFYASTVDQLYQSKDSKSLTTYIGRKNGRVYSPEMDYFKPEVSAARYAYSLEPATYSINYESLTKTDVCFYEDFLNYLKSYGGITSNHDRLFATKLYSYAPPIDIDKFVNYYNYYWLDIPIKEIPYAGVTDSEIENNLLGKSEWSWPDMPAITSGMRVTFPDSTKYTSNFYIEGVGRSISLVPDLYNLVSLNEFEYQPWDDTGWDTTSWDIAPAYAAIDYITMERGCKDGNAWSRSNRWVHLDAINASVQYHSILWPSAAERALRPIIEFKKDIELFNHGSNFIGEVNYPVDSVYTDIHNQPLAAVEAIIGASVGTGDTLVLLREVNSPVYTVNIVSGIVLLDATVYREYLENGQYSTTQYVPAAGDVLVITRGNDSTESYSLQNNLWTKIANQKSKSNQAPLFNLYDIDGQPLSLYNESNFDGSEIFSYSLNTSDEAPVDSVLNLPIIYKDLGQTADILFENDLMTDRYQYITGIDTVTDILGYYFYKVGDTYSNSWHYSDQFTKQFIVDEFVYGTDSTSNVFPVSALPDSDITVEINGNAVTNFVSSIVNYRNSITISGYTFKKNDFIKIRYYSVHPLEDNSRGYYEIPASLESNALNAEVYEYTLNEFNEHFNTIIFNQENIIYTGVGQSTNYRDTLKDLSKGTKIVQALSSLPKLMQCSNSDMDVLSALEYSKTEYTKFKNKFIFNANAVIEDLNLVDDNITTELLLRQVLELINAPRQNNLEFSHTNMFAFGDVYTEEQTTVSALPYVSQLNYSQLNNEHLYIWVDSNDTVEYELVKDVTNLDTMTMLVDGVHYTYSYDVNSNLVITFDTSLFGKDVVIRAYSNIQPSYMPATPAKLGILPAYIPQLILDDTYAEPTWVIQGHDGSKTIAYSTIDLSGNIIIPNMLDALLLDLEKRIYNSISYKFKDEDYLPLLTPADIVPVLNGYDTRYTQNEVNSIMFSQFNLWATKTRTNYNINQTYDPLNWKTINYSDSGYVGSWKNIYKNLFRTFNFNTSPWEMFEFSTKPSWWDAEYGVTVTGKYSSAFNTMWDDIKSGIIRQGDRAGQHAKYEYPSLTTIPVDANGDVIPVNTYFGISYNNNPDAAWNYGDLSPAEGAWQVSSEYPFAITRLMLLTKPAMFSSVFWDNQDRNTFYFESEFGNYFNVQYTSESNNNLRDSTNVKVHGEVVDGKFVIKFGYQHWCTDYMLKSSKSVTNLFGYKIRSLGISLASRMGGYTNSSTFRAYLESSSTTSSDSLRIPDTNLDILLHKGKPVKSFVYSGVIVRVTEDNRFAVYGYDNSKFSFDYYDIDTTEPSIKVTEGGKPAAFVEFENDVFYTAGQIVKYNTLFYSANVSHLATSFNSNNWTLLPSLPVTGGITVDLYKPNRNTLLTVQYGYEFLNVQEVFTFLTSYGYFLEDQGWLLEDTDSTSGFIKNWIYTAREFLYWASSENPTNSSVFLNPVSEKLTLRASRGYPNNVEKISNGFYSILDKAGTAIDPKTTIISRNDQEITVQNSDSTIGIYMLRVSTSETEHIVVFDNTTSFGDIVYDPVLSVRQDRIKLSCVLTQNWFGKFEAPGYLIVGNELIQNYENLVASVKDYYDTESLIDNQDIESAARALIGYQDRSYLNNLGINDEVQFNFYQGFVKEKGTNNSIDKLLRSTLVESDGSETNISEDWAFKLAEFGGIGNQELDIKILPDYAVSKKQVISVDYTLPSTSKVAIASVVRSETLYNSTPEIEVVTRLDDPNISNVVPAILKANIVNRKLVSVDIEYAGYGYTLTPTISIAGSTDIVSLTMEYDIVQDTNLDYNYIANIFDRSRIESIKPYESNFTPLPVVTKNELQLPIAGYGNLNDVDYYVYNTDQFKSLTTDLRNKTLYVANLYNRDWNIYTLLLDPLVSTYAVGEYAALTNVEFNLRNTLAISDTEVYVYSEINDELVKYVCRNEQGTYNLYNIDGITPILFTAVDGYVFYTFKSLRQLVNKPLDFSYPIKWVDNINIAVAVVGTVSVTGEITGIDILHQGNYATAPNCKVQTLTGNGAIISISLNDAGGIMPTIVAAGLDYQVGDQLLFSRVDPTWAVIVDSQIHRQEEKLIDNSNLNESYLYSSRTDRTLSRMPVFDPVKGLFPGIIDRNIDYKTLLDPAVYDSTKDADDTFGENEVGRVWWDLSSSKFMWYEQPMAATGESEEEIITYRRQYWGKVFPGAPVDVYEWTESWSEPAQYTGGGTVKNTTEYVVKDVYNSRTLEFETKYFFWVKNKFTKPSTANRVLSVSEISNMIRNIQSSGYESFACIYKTSNKDIYALFNVDHIINNDICTWNISYGQKNNKHTEWKLLSEIDSQLDIPTSVWNKFVDSMCGYTNETSEEYPDAINIDGKYILPVPDRRLNPAQRYGINYRPRQTMFVDLNEARREFTYKVNLMLASQLTVTEFTNEFLVRTDWFASGFNELNTKPNTQVQNSSQLGAIESKLFPGAIVYVTSSGQYLQYDGDQFAVVRYKNGTLQIIDSFYKNDISLYNIEYRNLINFLIDKINIIEVFFTMVRYSLSEQSTVDWCFKTSYINVKQSNKQLSQDPFFSPAYDDNLRDYINEAKPYHTKIRNYINSLAAPLEILPYDASDSFTFNIGMQFNQVCNNFGWDIIGWDTGEWDPSDTPCTYGIVIDGGSFVAGWDSSGWDTTAWDIDSFEYDLVIDAMDFETLDSEYEYIYNASLFNSPYNNGAARELYVNGVAETILIKVSELNIPADIDINTYTIDRNLIGQTVTSDSGSVVITETINLIALSSSPT